MDNNDIKYFSLFEVIMHPAWIEIDLDIFRHNLSLIKNVIKDVKLCLPVKANSYGHGLSQMASAAEEAGVDYLAVAHLNEAIELRKAHIKIPILVLGAIHEEQIPELLAHDLEITVSSRYKAIMLLQVCRSLKKKCRVHLEVDTGMRRTGMKPATAAELFAELRESPFFEIVGVYSHLATGSSPEDKIAIAQIDAFSQMLRRAPFFGQKLLAHLANSPGTLNFPSAYFDMVRPALICFGIAPNIPQSPFNALAPCFSLKAKVSYFKVVEEGEGISYGHSFIAKKRTRIVTIPVGYGDGFRRELSNKGSVLIRGQRFPIVGTICMDQFMVDVGESSVFVGDEVVLIGKQGIEEISVQEVADLCGTIPYEILCLFNERIPRRYLG